jgi:aryl-alcohol dehydrogenase
MVSLQALSPLNLVLSVWRTSLALPGRYPSTIGHEGAGIVKKSLSPIDLLLSSLPITLIICPTHLVGSKVQRVQEGDSVILSFASCQHCGPCSVAKPAACPEWVNMNFLRKRNPDVDSRPAYRLSANVEEGEKEVYGAFFGQGSMARMSLVSESSVRIDYAADI